MSEREREGETSDHFWPWQELQFWFGTLCITLNKCCCCSIFYVAVVVALLLLLLLGLSDAVVSGRAALWNLWFIECAWKTVSRADTDRAEGQPKRGVGASSRLPIVPTGKNKSIEFISRNNKTVKWRMGVTFCEFLNCTARDQLAKSQKQHRMVTKTTSTTGKPADIA